MSQMRVWLLINFEKTFQVKKLQSVFTILWFQILAFHIIRDEIPFKHAFHLFVFPFRMMNTHQKRLACLVRKRSAIKWYEKRYNQNHVNKIWTNAVIIGWHRQKPFNGYHADIFIVLVRPFVRALSTRSYVSFIAGAHRHIDVVMYDDFSFYRRCNESEECLIISNEYKRTDYDYYQL